MANKLNVHQTAISQWETGRTSPDMDVAAEMAQLFDVSLEYLLGISDEKSAPDPTWINVLGRVAAGIPIEAIVDRKKCEIRFVFRKHCDYMQT